ncbi:MAG: ferritin family protein [candidate division WOR-3 bacterium]|nr:ferritin family protein [candidate division WOR-3 bacterium]
MTVFYSPIEVIEMAMKIEERGNEFYLSAGKKVKSKPLKELFVFLANEELKHHKTFKGLYNLINQEAQSLPYNWDEASRYLQAITDSKFFLSESAPMSYLARVKTAESLLKYAIEFEKATLLFYYEIKNLVKDEHRPLVDKIISQEKQHIEKLSVMKGNG